jgi:hypothetical protein
LNYDVGSVIVNSRDVFFGTGWFAVIIDLYKSTGYYSKSYPFKMINEVKTIELFKLTQENKIQIQI